MKYFIPIGISSLFVLQLNACSPSPVDNSNPSTTETNVSSPSSSTPSSTPPTSKPSNNTSQEPLSNPFPDLKVNISGRFFTFTQTYDFFNCIASKATNVAFKTPAEKYLTELNELSSETDESSFKNKLTRIASNIQTTESFSGTDCKAESN